MNKCVKFHENLTMHSKDMGPKWILLETEGLFNRFFEREKWRIFMLSLEQTLKKIPMEILLFCEDKHLY